MSFDETVEAKLIAAERCDLRPIRRSDEGLIAHYSSDKRVADMTPSIPHPYPSEAAEAFVTRVTAPNRTEDVWAMDATRFGGPELMGLLTLQHMDRKQSEISYWVAPQYWNAGFGSDAVRALVAANPFDNDSMFASVFQDNPASAKVLTNCGFEYIGDADVFSVARKAKVPTWTYVNNLR